MAEAQPVEGLQVVIDEDTNTVRVNEGAGTVEQDQDDGGVVVQFGAAKKKQDDDTGGGFYENLVDKIDGLQLGSLANDLHSQIDADDKSREEYLNVRALGLGLMGLKLQQPRTNIGDANSAVVEGQSTVTNPLLLEACLKGWANAQAELLPSDGPCKVSDEADSNTLAEDELADAFERDMNHFLTTTATEYYPDTSHMLLWGVYFGGSGFKKVYRCPIKRRPTSESVDAKDLIVSDTTKDLKSCTRITHQIEMRPSVMKRMQFVGAYRKVDLPEGQPQPNAVDQRIASIQGTTAGQEQHRPEDRPYTIWEAQCELDLDEFAPSKFKGQGIALPYLVTMDKESKQILAIRRDWNEDDDDCKRKQMYVRYPYIPGPGFYGTGMVNILGNATSAMTAAWRLALDSAMFATYPSFLVSKLAGRQNTSDLRAGVGQGVPIETNGMPINSVVAPLPYQDVRAGMLTLIDKITQQAASLGAAGDIPTAEGVQNVPVGTMLAQIEQATKVEAAAHKGMHQAQAEEIRLIAELFRERPEDFWEHNTIAPPDYWTIEKFEQALNDYNLVPASDPNTPSHIHRVAKGMAVFQLAQSPVFAPKLDIDKTLEMILRIIRIDPESITLPPQAPGAQPPPDPAAMAQGAMAQAKLKQADTAQFKAQNDAQVDQAKLAIDQQKLAGEQNIAQTDLVREAIIHQKDSTTAAAELAQNRADSNRDHALAVAQHGLAARQASHDAAMDVAEHQLNVHQALNPPKPAGGE